MLRFTRETLKIFRSNPVLRRRSFFSGMLDGGRQKDVMWVRADGAEMTDADWSDPENRVLGMLIPGRATDERDDRGRLIRGDTVLLLLNGGSRSRKVTLPRLEGSGLWHEVLNTARPGHARVVRREALNLVAHSLMLLRFEGAERSSERSGAAPDPKGSGAAPAAPRPSVPLWPSRCRSSRAPLDRRSRGTRSRR